MKWLKICFKKMPGPNCPRRPHITLLTDLYSGFCFTEIMKTTTAVKVTERLENVFSIYGYPEKLRHDNGPSFSPHKFKQYLGDVNITDKAFTPEHPQSNAVVENFNRSLNKCLRIAKVQSLLWQNELKSIFTIHQQKSDIKPRLGNSKTTN